jgi:hypothetical protein
MHIASSKHKREFFVAPNGKIVGGSSVDSIIDDMAGASSAEKPNKCTLYYL